MSVIVEHQEALWLGALAAAPVAVAVAVLCRGVSRPGTRHVLWCLALLAFVVPGVLVATGWAGAIDGAVREVPRAVGSVLVKERGAAAGAARLSPAQPLGGEASVVSGPSSEAESLRSAEPTRAAVAPFDGAMPRGDWETEQPSFSARTGLDRSETEVVERTGSASRVGVVGALAVPEAAVPVRDQGVMARRGGLVESAHAPSVRLAEPRLTPPPHAGEGRRAGLVPTGTTGLAAEEAGESDWAVVERGSVAVERPRPLGLGEAGDAPSVRLAEPRLTPPPHAGEGLRTVTTEIADPVWLALRASVAGLWAWGDAIGEAVGSVLEIPAPPVALWVTGIVLIVVVGVCRALAGRAAVRRTTPVDRSDRRLVESLSERLGLARAPRAVLVRSRVSPMVCGWLNPRIVLPEALWRSLDLDARRAVLTHELAHLRRRDQWVRLIELMVGVVYWWHPVLWAVRRRIREEADLCCDAWVTTLFPGLRRSYAEALLRTRVYLSIPGAVAPVAGLGMASARSRRFSRRLTMVMTGQNRPKASPLGVALAVAVGTVALVVAPTMAHTSLAKKGDRCPPETGAVTTAAGGARAARGPASVSGTGTHGVSSASGHGAGDHAQHGHAHAAEHAHTAEHVMAHVFSSGSSAPTALGGARGGGAGGSLVQGSIEAARTPTPNDGVEARLRMLEARLERMDAMLQRLLERTEGRAGSAAPARAPVQTTTAVMSQSLLSAPQFELATVAGGEKMWVSYAVPEEKLCALWGLMARDDVPVWVRQEHGGIGFEGTAAQQEVFARFLAMIHPDEAGTYLAGLSGQARSADAFFAQGRAMGASPDYAAAIGAEFASRAAVQEQQARAIQERARAMEAELSARMMRQRQALTEQQRALERLMQGQSAQVETFMRRAAEMDGRAAEVEARAGTARGGEQRDRLMQQADELREQAEELRERAEELREEMEEARYDLEEALADLESDEADARAELEEAMAELRAGLIEVRARAAGASGSCACGDGCTGGECEDDCDAACHCRGGAAVAAPARAVSPAAPSAPARPARAVTPVAPVPPVAPIAPVAPATPRPQRD